MPSTVLQSRWAARIEHLKHMQQLRHRDARIRTTCVDACTVRQGDQFRFAATWYTCTEVRPFESWVELDGEFASSAITAEYLCAEPVEVRLPRPPR